MSDLLNSASLVMIPSGYKEDVVYSQIPTDGSGDLTFTRASNGTRINSAGLVEVCPWNLAPQSETFGVSPWSAINLGITSDATTAPNGTTTAEKLKVTTANTAHQVQQGFSNDSANHTVSIYAKKGELNFIQLALGNSVEQYANFNLNTGVVGTKGSYCASSSIESVGDGWYRCIAYFNQGTIPSLMVYVTNSASSDWGGIAAYAGANNTDGIYVWGYQVNIGSTAKPYFPTTDRLNVPRLTYQNGGGGCPSLLLEKQSTNYLNWSNDFTQSAWSASASITRTANYATSPDGTQTATRIQWNGTDGELYQYLGQSSPTRSSVYVKGTAGQVINFCLTQITLTGEWQRIDAASIIDGANTWFGIIAKSSVGHTATDFLLWGGQGEAGTYATSLIYTTSSSATRVADDCGKSSISSLIGQTEGVLFVDLKNPSGGDIASFGLNSSNTIYIIGDYNNSWGAGIIANSVNYAFTTVSNSASRIKIALAYKSGDSVLYINGVQVQQITSSFSFSASLSAVRFLPSAFYFSGPQCATYNQIAIFKTRLTNAELASLTTI